MNNRNARARLFRWTSIVLSLVATGAARGDEITASDAVNMLAGSISAVVSFDVRLEVVWKRLVVIEMEEIGKLTPADLNKGRKPGLKNLRRLRPDESPSVYRNRSRQIYQNGRGRFELTDGASAEPSSFFVYDRETQRLLQPQRRQATISKWDGISPGHQMGEDYREAFRSVIGDIAIVDSLSQRRNLMVKHVEWPSGGLVIEAPPENGDMPLPDWGIRVTVDPSHGFMPCEMEVYKRRGNKNCTESTRQVTDWRALGGGVWVPVRVLIKTYSCAPEWKDVFGTVMQEGVATVDESLSRWNVAIPDETFRLPFPSGTRVVDLRRLVQYTTGKPDAGDNLEELARQAKDIVPFRLATPPEEPPQNWTWSIVLGACLATLIVSAFALVFIRKRMAGS